MNVAEYLTRIGYDGRTDPTWETLAALHQAHLLAVPFENLDIHLGREIILDLPALYNKIVWQQRGGFCYELNGLFAWLLEALGFRVQRLSARVYGQHNLGPDFDHLLLRVDVPHGREGSQLADVGFGDSFITPLWLDEGATQPQANGAYRVVPSGSLRVLERRPVSETAAWEPQYLFSLTPYALEDFAGMCIYQQTSPDVPFTQRRMCTLLTHAGRGRVTLRDLTLIETLDGHRTETQVESERAFLDLLQERFGIVLGNPHWQKPIDSEAVDSD